MYNVDPLRYEHMRPGCYDVHERVRDMSAGGQLAGLNFPNWTGFSGQVLNQGPDRDVNLVMIKAYNDWHVDEWCGAYPDRFIPCGILPLFDVDEAATRSAPARGEGLPRGHVLGEPGRPRHAEHPHRRVGSAVRGVRRHGHRVVLPRRFVVEDARRRRPTRPRRFAMSLSSVMSIYTLGDLLWASFWHRFPTLRFALTEGDIGWIPYFLWRAEHTLDRHNGWMRHDSPQGLRPTELFRERILCCFIADRIGVKLLDEFNVDNVCWESDYPHSDSSWPHAPERLAELFAGLRRRDGRQDHAPERDAALQFDPFAPPAARALHRRGAAGRGGDVDVVTHGGPARRRARPRHLAAPDQALTRGDRAEPRRTSMVVHSDHESWCTGLLIILLVVLVLFGGSQLPKLARSLGSAQKEFKKGLDEGDDRRRRRQEVEDRVTK